MSLGKDLLCLLYGIQNDHFDQEISLTLKKLKFPNWLGSLLESGGILIKKRRLKDLFGGFALSYEANILKILKGRYVSGSITDGSIVKEINFKLCIHTSGIKTLIINFTW